MKGRQMVEYYSLAVRLDGKWASEFGAYDKTDVLTERHCVVSSYDDVRLGDTKIITTNGLQQYIDLAIYKLNEVEKVDVQFWMDDMLFGTDTLTLAQFEEEVEKFDNGKHHEDAWMKVTATHNER